ncbi:hypothetical protein D3C87_1820240 [compost metagenome]
MGNHHRIIDIRNERILGKVGHKYLTVTNCHHRTFAANSLYFNTMPARTYTFMGSPLKFKKPIVLRFVIYLLTIKSQPHLNIGIGFQNE